MKKRQEEEMKEDRKNRWRKTGRTDEGKQEEQIKEDRKKG